MLKSTVKCRGAETVDPWWGLAVSGLYLEAFQGKAGRLLQLQVSLRQCLTVIEQGLKEKGAAHEMLVLSVHLPPESQNEARRFVLLSKQKRSTEIHGD